MGTDGSVPGTVPAEGAAPGRLGGGAKRQGLSHIFKTHPGAPAWVGRLFLSAESQSNAGSQVSDSDGLSLGLRRNAPPPPFLILVLILCERWKQTLIPSLPAQAILGLSTEMTSWGGSQEASVPTAHTQPLIWNVRLGSAQAPLHHLLQMRDLQVQ